MWVTDKGLNRAYAYPMASLYTGSGNLNATTSKNLNSDNDNPTGITLINTTTLLRENNVDELPETGLTVKAYPNPNHGAFRLQIEGMDDQSECMVRVIDLSGKLILSRQLDAAEGQREESFDLEGAGQGVYLVFIEQGGQRKTLRVVVE
jgi:hypothetical protein